MSVASYEHPQTGATVVDVVCPEHPKVKGHVVTGQLGIATCGLIEKSHKEPGPDEIVDGKKVKTTKTVIDKACDQILVAQDNKKGKAVGSQIDAEETLSMPGLPHHSAARQNRAAEKQAESGKAKRAGAKGKKTAKTAKAAKRHPDAV